MFGDRPSKYDYEHGNVGRLGYMDDNRQYTGNDLTDTNREMLQDMMDIVGKWKKEIVKVPQCTTKRGAEEWVAARPKLGYQVGEEDIYGDSEKEVIVYDRAGRPFMVNGYRLKPSDFGLRKAYWTENPTFEQRVANPMREWAQNWVWDSKVDPENPWNRIVSKNTENYEKMKGWGYRMPTKPKTEASPYSIFSKLIAPMVKKTFHESTEVFVRIMKSLAKGRNVSVGRRNREFINKLISPISIYRYLYMRLIEQKFFFDFKNNPATRSSTNSYEKFKYYMKTHKDIIKKKFYKEILSEDMTSFHTNWVNQEAVYDALVKDDIDWSGADYQDGIVHMLGVKNISEGVTSTGVSFVELLIHNETADTFLNLLESKEKKDPEVKAAKKDMERFKKIAQTSMQNYLKNPAILKLFFEDDHAERTYIFAKRQGLPRNAVGENSAKRQMREVSSPAKKAEEYPSPEEELDLNEAEAAGIDPEAMYGA